MSLPPLLNCSKTKKQGNDVGTPDFRSAKGKRSGVGGEKLINRLAKDVLCHTKLEVRSSLKQLICLESELRVR